MTLISVVGDSVLFKKLVVRFFVEKYQSLGYQLNSAFGKAIFISNKVKPKKNSIVISTIERPNAEIVNLHNPRHFKSYFELIEHKKLTKLPEVISNPDTFYLKQIGLSIPENESYSHLIKEFIINFLTMQPLDDDLLNFVNKYYYLFQKFVEDLLEGLLDLPNYYLTIVASNKKDLIALANMLIKAENKEEFILYYAKKVEKNELIQ